MEFKISNKAKLTTILLVVVGVILLFLGLNSSHGEHTSQRLWANLLANGYFFFSISLAAVFFISLQYASEMATGVTTQRIFEAIMSFMPIGAIAILVVLIASSTHSTHLYHWMVEGVTDPSSPHYDKIIAGKSAYLNLPFYWFRNILFFSVWIFFAFWFRRNSLKEDQLDLTQFAGGVSPIYKKMKLMAVIFLVFFAYSSVSAVWDWIMSIDVHWFSTLFGWYGFSGMWVSCIIIAVILVIYLKSKGLLPNVNDSHIHDLTKWMFAISMVWSYMWFAQFMLIWYANVPEETAYYIERFNHYKVIYLATFFVNFLIPFFVLMSRDAKRNPIFFLPVALIIFVFHFMDVLLLIIPGTMHDHGHIGMVEFGMFFTFLGVFIFVVLNALSKAPLEVKNHPMYDESIHLHT